MSRQDLFVNGIAPARPFDHLFAFQDKCPRKKGPLSQGIVHAGCVTCSLHNPVIPLSTGTAQGAGEGGATHCPVRFDGRHNSLNLTPRIKNGA